MSVATVLGAKVSVVAEAAEALLNHRVDVVKSALASSDEHAIND
jgi:hypothetical protein